MKIRELDTFIAIVRYGGFNKAAEALNYTPTSVTNQIHNLEADLGTTLFERGKQLKLTPAGEMLYAEGVPLSNLHQKVEDHIQNFEKGVRGSVAIGAVQPFLDCYGPLVLRELSDAFPDISIQIIGGYSEELGSKLKNGSIDLLISGKKAYREFAFAVTQLGTYNNNLLVYKRGHRFDGIEELHVSDLNGERIMMGPKSSYWSQLFELSLKERGCSNYKRVVFDQVQNIYPFIQSGFMVSVLPNIPEQRFVMEKYNVSAKPLVDYLDLKNVNLLTNEPYVALSSAQQNVKNFIIDYVTVLKNKKYGWLGESY